MKPEIAKLLSAALRSGDYKQTNGTLTVPGLHEFCCLGVLCDLHAQAHPRGQGWIGVGYYGSSMELPDEVRKWAGMKSITGIMRTAKPSLVDHNDGYHNNQREIEPKTFKQIATIIDKNVEVL